MKASVCYKQNDLRTEALPIPEISDNEVLIKMLACGLCGTDIQKIRGDTVNKPTVLGHEVVGEIVKKGKNVSKFEIGDRVITAIHVPCFTCHYCNKGHYTICEQFRTNNIDPGGFAEFIRIPELHLNHLTHKVSNNVTDEEATLIEPIACCLHGLKQADIRPNDSVLIMGAGTIGILHAQLAKIKGANKVIVSDMSKFKLQKALNVGCDYAINIKEKNIIDEVNKITDGQGVDVIVIAAGVSSLVADAVNMVRRAGKIIVFSGFDKNKLVTIDVSRFFKDEISIIGTYSVTPYEFPEALDLLEKRKLNTKEMITHVYPLNKLSEAIDISTNPEQPVLKVIIKAEV
ncbi:zinc-dependent dehydrogenase [Gilliamella apicola]|uniref:zinc-dependent dehydrogenase n=1 Tax=Gilliamella apicola TaxID=1196095 RepID=UPI00080E8290|nr:zinc-dependent dehydrogenase [Gilliamella apicola]OCG12049.1 L-iditol 2-dehydrogenase [Gilliamella apicola]ORF47036.1 L-iditol 2-dehydrogenase [Gilliamella apicola]ORF49171.1 L-iditol 2-dehydrogenase [Gilliamella apicola]ORF49981.1 L-iditol 2-dehydrogenase [Gilliamella apicola]ORF52736.1 L-iditol 2-dehydrogenase [Gilliamella apicola]